MVYELKDTEKAAPLFEGWQESMIWSCLQKIMGKIYADSPEHPVSAMALLAGLKEGNTDPSNEEGKEKIYLLVRQMSDKFREENGTIICRELLGLLEREDSARPERRTEEYYAARPCSRLVASAARIIEENLLFTDEEKCHTIASDI